MISHRTSAALEQSDAVVRWRRGRLLDAGYTPALAARLARDCEIEAHAVLSLIGWGCSPELAARILTPLDDDRWPC